MYSAKKPYKVGDIIMVLVVESTSAIHRSGTDTTAQDNLSVSLNHTIERLYGTIGPSNSVQGSGSNTYKGAGTTSRTSNVLATIATTVTNVLPNDNLMIEGTHRVSVNEELQAIAIKGVIRPNDVTGWNTIYSYQVADSVVMVKGTGSIADASNPGIITRLLNIIF